MFLGNVGRLSTAKRRHNLEVKALHTQSCWYSPTYIIHLPTLLVYRHAAPSVGFYPEDGGKNILMKVGNDLPCCITTSENVVVTFTDI